MGKLCAKAHIVTDFEIALVNCRSHEVTVDQPRDLGKDVGPTSLELCLMSHAGCYATICALTAKKMRLPLKGCDVKVEAVKSEEAGTIVEENFEIVFNLDAPEDRVQRLHELTLKNCPVGILFERAGVKIQYNLRTEKN
jgi:putative redox protein